METNPGFEDKQHEETAERCESEVEVRENAIGMESAYFHEIRFNISISRLNYLIQGIPKLMTNLSIWILDIYCHFISKLFFSFGNYIMG